MFFIYTDGAAAVGLKFSRLIHDYHSNLGTFYRECSICNEQFSAFMVGNWSAFVAGKFMVIEG